MTLNLLRVNWLDWTCVVYYYCGIDILTMYMLCKLAYEGIFEGS